jgi:hypothetical protein
VAPRLPLGHTFADAPGFLANQLLPAVRAVPGVVEAAAANTAPLGLGPSEFSRFATRFGIAGRAFDPGSFPVAQTRWITPMYFGVLGIPLEGGRWLTASDDGQLRVLVNATLARRFFPRGAVGQHLVLGVMDAQQSQLEIVGVVGDVRDFGLDRAAEPTFYGIGASPVMTLLVRSNSPGAAAAIRRAIHGVDPDIAVSDVRPLEQDVAESFARRRFALLSIAAFGAVAAFLTAAGIYALFAQSVSARTREFGVRAALGAAPGELVRMIVRESAAVVIPGLVLGTALALGFARIMKAFVYRVSPADPLSIAAAALFLAALAALSAWAPARRAAAVDPASALRSE